MYAGIDFDPIQPGESDIFSFEFTDDLPPGRTINEPTFQCSVVRTDPGATVDGSPQSRILGSAAISAITSQATGQTRTFANQLCGGFIKGNLYALQATVLTSDDGTLKRYSRTYCLDIR